MKEKNSVGDNLWDRARERRALNRLESEKERDPKQKKQQGGGGKEESLAFMRAN